MDTTSSDLTQAQLLALAVDAARRGDDADSVARLRAAATRDDASAEVFFLLGSQLAQAGAMDEALRHMARAIELAPRYAIARFQLGLLLLTQGLPQEALGVWVPLASLPADDPLRSFRLGLEHLIKDEFADAVACLRRGIALNAQFPALNEDMSLLIDRIHGLPATTATEGASSADEGSASHLFLSAYRSAPTEV
jgi:tetratricopeptide (TPR) repeat protein